MTELKIATWNLYQFAKPGTYWYERDERNDYEPDQWEEKKGWIAETLATIDADIIGFQEIFSVEEFRAFMEEQGYPHTAVVDTPAVDPQDETVFLGPVTGIASRYPFSAPPMALAFPEELHQNTQLKDNFGFRRAITRAENSNTGTWSDRGLFLSFQITGRHSSMMRQLRQMMTGRADFANICDREPQKMLTS